MDTIWERTKRFFNQQPLGGPAVTRRQLFRSVLNELPPAKSTKGVDAYRAMLMAAGYLARVRLGYYKVMKRIPKTLSLRDCREEAYGGRKVS